MKKQTTVVEPSEALMSLGNFLKQYNQTIPSSFPQASISLLKKFKSTHTGLFKHGNLWSLDEHRKKILDWLPQDES
jgi:hypothetical protein